MISVITPTRDRQRFLPSLLATFAAQTHPDRELLILDDSSTPAALPEDPRVRYLHSPERLPLGEKRNRLVAAARGEMIAHFDDDDHYAPRYLARMVELLGENDLVKLSAWFTYSAALDRFFYWQTDRVHDLHYILAPSGPLDAVGSARLPPTFVPDTLPGYGFSYVYRRAAALARPFPALDFGEDHAFARALIEAGRPVRFVPDEEGLAIHVLHGGNSSKVFPQFQLPRFVAERYFPGRLPALEAARSD
jgi:glycosyltransferase involved in cell wall biosynthesis